MYVKVWKTGKIDKTKSILIADNGIGLCAMWKKKRTQCDNKYIEEFELKYWY